MNVIAVSGQKRPSASRRAPAELPASTPEVVGTGHELDVLAAVAERSPEAYVLVDDRGRVSWCSPQIEELLGQRPETVIGLRVEDLLVTPEEISGQMAGQSWIGSGWASPSPSYEVGLADGDRLVARRVDGEAIPIEVRTAPFDEHRVLCVVRDARDRIRLEAQLRRLASTDSLTGLANRRTLLQHVDEALARARRRGAIVGLCYLDLDRFKDVNDDFGHEAGDQVLRTVADAFAAVARQGELVGRVGGDEFVVCLEELGADPALARAAASAAGRRFAHAARVPVLYAGRRVEVGASAGVGLSLGVDDADDLLRLADRALYAAKSDPARSLVVLSA